MAEAFLMAIGGSVGVMWSYVIICGPVIIFALLCRLYKNGETQLLLAKIFSLVYSFVMALVLIFLVKTGIECWINPTFLFFAFIAAIHVLVALLHFDPITLCCGFIYYLLIPSCFIFLQIYMIANLNDVSWGTRSGGSTKKKTKRKMKQAKGFVPKMKQFVFGPEYEEVEIQTNKSNDYFAKTM